MYKEQDLQRPVFTLRTLPELVEAGAHILFVCKEEPQKLLSNWKGNWRVYASENPKEKPDELKVLVSYNSVNPKDHRSTNALFSLAKSIGLKRLTIPQHLGEFEVFTKEDFDFSEIDKTEK